MPGQGDFVEGIPDFQNAIGLSGEGADTKVEGVDVEIGKMEFSITHKVPEGSLDAGYEAYAASVTPSINHATWSFVWRGQLFAFTKGSVKFRGHSTNDNGTGIELTHNFAYSKPFTRDTDPWDGSTTYEIGDVVSHNGYRRRSLVVATLTNEPRVYPEWGDQTIYAFGAVVQFDLVAYESISVIPSQTWDATEDYVVGEYVLHGGGIYLCINDSTDEEPQFFPASWIFLLNAAGSQPDESPTEWRVIANVTWENIGNTTGLKIGNAFIEKEGWELMTPWFNPGIQNGVVVSRPRAILIQRIHDYSDFGQLRCFN